MHRTSWLMEPVLEYRRNELVNITVASTETGEIEHGVGVIEYIDERGLIAVSLAGGHWYIGREFWPDMVRRCEMPPYGLSPWEFHVMPWWTAFTRWLQRRCMSCGLKRPSHKFSCSELDKP